MRVTIGGVEARVVAFALVALAAGCDSKREAQPTVTIAPPDPLCHRFGGKIHGTSRCWTLDRRAEALTASERRIRPGGGASFECNYRRQTGDLSLDGATLRVTCLYDDGGAEHVRVSLVVVDDRRFPALRGRAFDLGDGGFTDFVNVIARPRGDAIDLSVDFGVLD